MSTAPTQTPGKKSNLLWWVLGLGAAAIILFSVCGLLIANLFVKEVHVREGAPQVEIQTPAGQVTLGSVPAESLGLPVYPGATRAESGGGVELTTPQDEKVGVVGVKYSTADALEKVDTWYREHLGPEFQREGPGTKRIAIHAHGVTIGSEDTAFISDRDDLVRVVGLKKRRGGVEIEMVRVGKRETQ